MVLFAGSLFEFTKFVLYFIPGFMIIPTGRDAIAPGYPLMPGDDKLFPAMTGEHPSKGTFMWRIFGINFVTLSIIKIWCVSMGVAAMSWFILFAVYGTIATGLLIYYKPDFDSKGADISPFLALFALETIAYYLTILM